MKGNIIGINGDYAETLWQVFASDSRDFVGHMLHKRTVITDEHHHQTMRTFYIGKSQFAAIEARKTKVWGVSA